MGVGEIVGAGVDVSAEPTAVAAAAGASPDASIASRLSRHAATDAGATEKKKRRFRGWGSMHAIER